MLTDINWNEKLCNFDDEDDMCEEFSKTFLQISSACIPSKTILIREKDKPWFSNEIRKEIRIRLINIFIIFQYILGFEELFNKKLSKLFSHFSFAIFFILFTLFLSSISKLDEENVILPQFDSKTNNIIHEIHITENEIIDVIQILDPNKATGPDKISNKILKISVI
jgi:hypothetical protein